MPYGRWIDLEAEAREAEFGGALGDGAAGRALPAL